MRRDIYRARCNLTPSLEGRGTIKKGAAKTGDASCSPHRGPRPGEVGGHRGRGESPGCPPCHQLPCGGSRVAAGGDAAMLRLNTKRADLAAVGLKRFILISNFIAGR